jgi:hypothetical protein
MRERLSTPGFGSARLVIGANGVPSTRGFECRLQSPRQSTNICRSHSTENGSISPGSVIPSACRQSGIASTMSSVSMITR